VLTKSLELHPHCHQVPMHHCHSSLQHQLSVLQHLVPPAVSKYSLFNFVLTIVLVLPQLPPQFTPTLPLLRPPQLHQSTPSVPVPQLSQHQAELLPHLTSQPELPTRPSPCLVPALPVFWVLLLTSCKRLTS